MFVLIKIRLWLNLAILFGLGLASCLHAQSAAPVKIALIGDSTVCDYRITLAKRGWGQMLPEFLKSGVVVQNEARGGASTLSFPVENWRRVKAARPDFVFIQFGHNDMKKNDPKRYADAAADYRTHLKRYIAEIREWGGIPVLVTPVRRRTFRQGALTAELEPYAEAVRIVGGETSVAVIDLHRSSGEIYQRLGSDGSEAYTANKRDNPEAPRPDLTHFSEFGAREIARLVIAEFPRVDARLAVAVKSQKN